MEISTMRGSIYSIMGCTGPTGRIGLLYLTREMNPEPQRDVQIFYYYKWSTLVSLHQWPSKPGEC